MLHNKHYVFDDEQDTFNGGTRGFKFGGAFYLFSFRMVFKQ